jgi:hypothetical protein
MKDLSLVIKQVKKSVYAAIEKVEDRHAFDFKLDREWCRFVHKHGRGAAVTGGVTGVPEALYPEFDKLCREIFRFEERTKSLKLRPLDMKIFLYQFFRSKAEINKALRRVPVSVRLSNLP